MKSEKRYIIYRWKNKINGKCYIGLTSNPRNRKRHHAQGYSNSWIAQAIKKHGIDSFEYTELENGLTQEQALEKERFYIMENDSFGKGYNQTPGGYFITGPKFGENNHNSVISEKTAIKIIMDSCNDTKAAKKYGTTRSTVNNIRCGNTWTYLDRTKAPKYDNGRSKLTKETVKKIFLDTRSRNEIALDFGIDVSTVALVKNKKRWSEVTQDLVLKEKTPKQKDHTKKEYAVYRIMNTINDKHYYGITNSFSNKSNINFCGSKRVSAHLCGTGSQSIYEDVQKHGRKVFISQIMSEHDNKEEAEKRMYVLILRHGALYPTGYNKTLGGRGSYGCVWNSKQRQGILGTKNINNKLTVDDVISIYYDDRKMKEIAQSYDISATTVSNIKKGKVWSHVTHSL